MGKAVEWVGCCCISSNTTMGAATGGACTASEQYTILRYYQHYHKIFWPFNMQVPVTKNSSCCCRHGSVCARGAFQGLWYGCTAKHWSLYPHNCLPRPVKNPKQKASQTTGSTHTPLAMSKIHSTRPQVWENRLNCLCQNSLWLEATEWRYEDAVNASSGGTLHQ